MKRVSMKLTVPNIHHGGASMSAIKPIRAKWKSEMTDRERFNNQMHYKPVDRCFNMEFGYWEENYSKWDIFKDNGITNERDANMFFGFDRIEGIYVGNMWMNPKFASTAVSETATTRLLINEDGILIEVPKDGHDTIPHYIKPTIVTPDDWMICKKERFRRDDPARIYNIGKLKERHPSNRDYPLCVWCGSMIGRIRDMLTFEGLAYACYDYPEMVEDMVETSCVLVEDSLAQLLPHFDFDYGHGWEDICFKNGPIVTVPFFRDVIMPRYTRISKLLANAGIDTWSMECDGDVRPILPYFLEGGVNCMFPFEVNGCAHPSELFDKFGKELRIMGGFDKLQLGDGREAIKAYMETLVPLVARGGFIPFCDHLCPPNVSPGNYLYYLDLKEEMFGMT